jgi:LysM repeat protein
MMTLSKYRFLRLSLVISILLTTFSATYAFPPDSLRTKWVGGKKFLLHKVTKGETWTSVAKKYHITIAELQNANNGVSVLKYNQIIQVPATASTSDVQEDVVTPAKSSSDADEAPKPVKQKPESPKSTKDNPKVKYHTVTKGETLYRIAKDNNMSLNDLKELNNLSNYVVKVGMKLKVAGKAADDVADDRDETPAPKPVKEPIKESVKEPVKHNDDTEKPKPAADKTLVKSNPVVTEPKTNPVKSDTNSTLPEVYSNPGASRNTITEKDPKTGATIDKITETGVANWLTDGELNQNKFYALHRTAPVGTIIKVTNRMNNNSVFVKVVGILPDTGDNKNVMIKITQAAAQRIGALDQKFTAELSYAVNK